MEDKPLQEGAEIIKADFAEVIAQLEQQLADKREEVRRNQERFKVLSRLEREYAQLVQDAYGERFKSLQDLRSKGETEISELERELLPYTRLIAKAEEVASAETIIQKGLQ